MRTLTAVLTVVLLTTPSFADDFDFEIDRDIEDIKAALSARSEVLQLLARGAAINQHMISDRLGKNRLRFRSSVLLDMLEVEPQGSDVRKTALRRIITGKDGKAVAEIKKEGGVMEVNLTTGLRRMELNERRETIHIRPLTKKELKRYGIYRKPSRSWIKIQSRQQQGVRYP